MTSFRFARVSSLVLPALPALAVLFAGTGTGGCASQSPSGPSQAAGVQVDQTEIVSGVPDTGQEPAVVALDVGEGSLCTGSLIAPDVLLTARHCVTVTVDPIACPSTAKQVLSERAPSSLRVLVGDDIATAQEVAHGVSVFEPPGDQICDADIALVLLDQAVDVDTLGVSVLPITVGDHVTAVGYGRKTDADPPGTKLLREHVEVLSLSPTEFTVGEATCQGDSGGPALDEGTNDIVGVVSRGGATCTGPGAHNVYTRTDAFAALIDQALAASAYTEALLEGGMLDAGADAGADAGKKKPTKRDGGATKPASDMGDPCTTAGDCAAGVCVTGGGKQYCSRSCGTGDRCPAHFHCTATSPTEKVCIET
jgi:V8-like Glu-specific endopeptidase